MRSKVTDIAWFGRERHVWFENDSGAALTVNVQNESRRTAPPVVIGDVIRVSWAHVAARGHAALPSIADKSTQ